MSDTEKEVPKVTEDKKTPEPSDAPQLTQKHINDFLYQR